MSKKEDLHFTQIHFQNSPIQPNLDVDFAINCPEMAKMNVSIKKINEPETTILSDHSCTTFKTRFSNADYNFGTKEGVDLTTFYVNVYNIQPPTWIRISFSHSYRKN